MGNNLVENLKELLRCYELMNSEDSPIIKEINMWRNMFLNMNSNEKDGKEKKRIYYNFKFMPSETFMNKTASEWLEEIKSWKNK